MATRDKNILIAVLFICVGLVIVGLLVDLAS